MSFSGSLVNLRFRRLSRVNPLLITQLHTSSIKTVQIKNIDSDLRQKPYQEGKKVKTLRNEVQSLCAWKDQDELLEELFENIVYHEPESDKSGLVVLNKPYGLPRKPSDDSLYALESVLPLLSDRLEVKSLQIVKCTERFTSGITLLGTSNITSEKFHKAMRRCVTDRILPSSHLAIVKGSPNIHRNEDVDLKLTDCPEVNDPLFGSVHREPVISRHLAKPWKLKRQEIKRVHVNVDSVARNPGAGAGVVSLSSSKVSNHFIQVYLADIGHPVIGDMLYDYRSRTVLGKRIRITSHTNARRTQVLPYPLLEPLGLKKGEEWMLPKMLHQYKIHLPKWNQGKDITIFAPPLAHWMRTCQLLELNFNFKEFAEQDKIAHFKQNNNRAEKKKKKREEEQEALTDLQQSIVELP